MKNFIITATVCFALGLSVGWLAKPTASALDNVELSSSSEREASKSRGRSTSRSGARSTSRPDRSGPSDQTDWKYAEAPADIGVSPEMREMIIKSSRVECDFMKRRLKDQSAILIASMIQELGLNTSQEKELRAFYAEQVAKLNSSTEIPPIMDDSKLTEIASALRGDGVNERMQNVLTDQQMKELEAMQERKRNSEIESRALKSLSKLQLSLNLTDDQKDKVYGVLIENAENHLTSQSDSEYVASVRNSSMGLEQDAEGMDMETEMDPQARLQWIEDKMKRLSPHLNEVQLKQYRKSLENQGAGFRSVQLKPKSEKDGNE